LRRRRGPARSSCCERPRQTTRGLRQPSSWECASWSLLLLSAMRRHQPDRRVPTRSQTDAIARRNCRSCCGPSLKRARRWPRQMSAIGRLPGLPSLNWTCFPQRRDFRHRPCRRPSVLRRGHHNRIAQRAQRHDIRRRSRNALRSERYSAHRRHRCSGHRYPRRNARRRRPHHEIRRHRHHGHRRRVAQRQDSAHKREPSLQGMKTGSSNRWNSSYLYPPPNDNREPKTHPRGVVSNRPLSYYIGYPAQDSGCTILGAAPHRFPFAFAAWPLDAGTDEPTQLQPTSTEIVSRSPEKNRTRPAAPLNSGAGNVCRLRLRPNGGKEQSHSDTQ